MRLPSTLALLETVGVRDTLIRPIVALSKSPHLAGSPLSSCHGTHKLFVGTHNGRWFWQVICLDTVTLNDHRKIHLPRETIWFRSVPWIGLKTAASGIRLCKWVDRCWQWYWQCTTDYSDSLVVTRDSDGFNFKTKPISTTYLRSCEKWSL